ncbi:hypothetical protein MMC20_005647 [Loxospora ochrophaea]|nr:hypothetical protein [Loxospora ochrophaea]
MALQTHPTTPIRTAISHGLLPSYKASHQASFSLDDPSIVYQLTLYSSSPPNSACVTISNALEDQYIFYCSNVATVVTLSYRNLVTTGSTASSPSKSGDSTPSTQIPTNVSTQSSPAASKTTSSSSPTASVVTADEQASLPRHTLAAIIAPIICVALLLVFCLYMFCVRPRLARKHDASPSAGTLGGASLPGPIQETSSQMRDPRKTLPIWSRARAKESPISSAPDTRISSPQTLVSTTPLPNCTQQSPKLELDSKPVSPHTPHTPGASTIRPVELSPTSSTFPSTPNPPTPPSTHKPPLQNSPTVSSENHHVSLALSSLSPEERDSRYLSLPTTVNSHTNRLSATGSWKGYLTPEEAMNGGWRAEEQENGD